MNLAIPVVIDLAGLLVLDFVRIDLVGKLAVDPVITPN